MRIDVEARLATQAHVAAMDAAIEAHEETAARALDRIVRRYVRQGVARFTRGVAGEQLVAAAGDFDAPSWRFPIPVDLLDQEAMEAELETRAAGYSEDVARTTTASMGANLGIELNQSNALLEGVIAAQAGKRITTAPQDLVKVMMGSLQESYDAGHSIPKAAKAMRAAGYAHSKSYAVRIARTELIGAVNAASLAMVQGATNLPYKTWMATGDNRTRPTHRAADSQVVPIDSTFVVGSARLEYPGDRNGPGEEVIMCRCTIGYTDEPFPGAGAAKLQPSGSVLPPADEMIPIPSTWGHTDMRGSDEYRNTFDHWETDRNAIMQRYDQLDATNESDGAHHLRAWRAYIGSGHHDMNAQLRGRNLTFGGDPSQIRKLNDDFDAMFAAEASVFEDDALLFRGMLLKDPDTAASLEITDPAFVSASMDLGTARGFIPSFPDRDAGLYPVLMRLHAPKGTKAIAGNGAEQEWVLPTGTRYFVVGEGEPLVGGERVFDAIILLPGQTAEQLIASMEAAA